ncbi:SDR family oxidoreductase [Streptomyces brevispora]|uniref:SDR family oxidoreductase n=1 Tax=Streptomyces brevispora TaxID=887462 RepID=UPI002E33759E|nr:SDR family oxidoreductase [Streptomyces brevispora]
MFLIQNINIGSVGCITGNFSTAYSGSEWALEGLSRSAAYRGIRCNVIQPDWIEADLTAGMNSNPVMRKMQEHAMNTTVLLRRSGKAEEIANTAPILAGEESSFITGTDIFVDGGWSSAAAYLGNERSRRHRSPPRSPWPATRSNGAPTTSEGSS